jgi:uncharacterized protein YyaL (SSP411 family)
LVLRPRTLTDQGVPAPIAVACRVLLKLGHYKDPRYSKIATLALEEMLGLTTNDPVFYGSTLIAADDALAQIQEVAIVGPFEDPKRHEMLRILNTGYRPYLVSAASQTSSEDGVVFLDNRRNDSVTRAYVCQGQRCGLPIEDPQELERVLEEP